LLFRGLPVFVLTAWVLPFLLPIECLSQAASQDAPVAPFTVLFDTGAVSAMPLAGEAVLARKGWTAVPEDNLTRPFAGDAVFMNDRVAVVVRRGSDGPEVYSRSHGSLNRRATLHPIHTGGAAGVISSVRIIENSQAAVMLEATSVASGAEAMIRLRLSAGEALLEVRGAHNSSAMGVVDHAKYVVVPDFFADDMVIDPTKYEGSKIGLPAENSVLGLADEGRAIVACVWPSPRQEASLMLSGAGQQRSIASYRVGLGEGDRLWVAVMEGKGIWHARPSTGSGQAPSTGSGQAPSTSSGQAPSTRRRSESCRVPTKWRWIGSRRCPRGGGRILSARRGRRSPALLPIRRPARIRRVSETTDGAGSTLGGRWSGRPILRTCWRPA
jgi:hypothetical protein